jgi:hypothetical protein
MSQVVNSAVDDSLINAQIPRPLPGFRSFLAPFHLDQFTEPLLQEQAVCGGKLADALQNFLDGGGTHLDSPSIEFNFRILS